MAAVEPTARTSARATGLCPLLSTRLRKARTDQALSLRKLAARVGVSASLISQVETGKVQPSVNTLYALARELGLSIDDLLYDGPDADRDGGSGRAAEARDPVVRSGERRVIELDDGVRWERLTRTPDDGVDFFHVIYEPGAASMPAGSLHRHAGREWGHVTAGRLVVELGSTLYELATGDSITFDSTTPHRLSNPGREQMRALWFVVGRARDGRFEDGAAR